MSPRFLRAWSIGALAFLALGSIPASAQQLPVVDQDHLALVTSEVILRDFPELKRAWDEGRIGFSATDSDEFFLSIQMPPRSYLPWITAKTREYRIAVNPAVFRADDPLPETALRGILAHELVHLMDYERGGWEKIVSVLARTAVKPAPYERSTDARAFARGYAEGIRAYREWLYRRLDRAALRKKRRNYFTPGEIDAWMEKHG